MYFNTIQYFIFLPLVCLLYYVFNPRHRWAVLFTASCIFYMWFIPEYILCLFFLIIVDFCFARKIEATALPSKRRLYLLVSIVSNFGLLFYFKYLGFFVDNINLVLEPLLHTRISHHSAILPIGLSFHTFQSVSYVIDVYRGQQKAERHLGIYSTYVLFFPQMVAGPIERYSTLGEELKVHRRFHTGYLKTSLPLILTGLFYKMVIADNCGAYVNDVYEHMSDANGLNVLLAILLFSIQIYCDFFGYSLMAQGSAQLLGIHLVDNFRFPFFALNLADYWRRWHLSLTGWFRSYVFIPLGGSKAGRYRHYRNILLIFVLSGFWHGASWNFVIWGFLHGLGYLVAISALSRYSQLLPALLRCVFTFLLVSFIFVFFRSDHLSSSIQVFKALGHDAKSFDGTLLPLYLLLCIAFMFTLEYFARQKEGYRHFLFSVPVPARTLILFMMLFCLFTFAGIDNLPFIYFQF